MRSSIKSERLRIGGMSCAACKDKIERKLRNTAGVNSAQVNFNTASVDISYDPAIVSHKDIEQVIEKLGYQVLSAGQWPSLGRTALLLAIIMGIYLLLQHYGLLNLLVPGQLADGSMSYGMLFVIGLITSVHCVAMCGGINLSQCIPKGEGDGNARAAFAPAFFYNLGRVISYTVIGFLLGLVGMLFGGSGTGLSVFAQGLLKLFAGALMVIMGINMLGLFPQLRKFQPRLPKFLAQRINADKARSNSALLVGLLNGLMPCGPLQSMQIIALASGNPFTGAISMLLFSLGTVPLMLGLGSLVTALGRKFTRQMMIIGAILVAVLGLAMLEQGGSLSGLLPPNVLLTVILGLCAIGLVSRLPFRKPSLKRAAMATLALVAIIAILPIGTGLSKGSATQAGSPAPADSAQASGEAQVIMTNLRPGRYPNITVQAGVPVKWILHAPEGSINGCNYMFNIREYGIEGYTLEPGDNVIEFTPTETGKFYYSCWMGMIRASITVTESETDASPSEEPQYPALETESAPLPPCCT